MADNNTQNNSTQQNNNETDNQNNNQTNQNQQNGGGNQKHVFALGMDANAQSDFANIEKIKSALEACGNTVGVTQRGPNQEAFLASKAKEINADVAIFCCLVSPATIWSFRNAIKSGKLPHTVFAIEGWMAKAKSHQEVMDWPFVGEHDSGQFCNAKCQAEVKSEGNTIGEWLNAGNSQYISIAYGSTPEELAQNICNGNYNGGGTGGQVTDSGGGAAIKDKTFEDCIRRICAATDSVFMVENNAAVMFPYTDWMAFTLRQKMKKINAKMIDRDLYEKEYNTDGFYNKVTTVYGAEEDTTINTKNNEQNAKQNNKNDKDNKNIDSNNQTDKQTNGNVTKERKTMPTGGTQLSQQYDPLVKKYGVLEKKVTTNFPNEETAKYVSNALLIQYVREFNNSCRFRMLNNQKLIGGTFYNIQDPFDKTRELYYLNSYTVLQRKKEPITSDVEFKYGPEGVENVMDYQRYSGVGGASAGVTGDGSATEQQIWSDAAKVHYCHCNSTQDPETAYKNIHGHEGEANCKTDCYGMSAYLYYRFNNQAGIPCRVIGNSTHHVVTLYKNNAWYEPIEEYRQLEEMFHYISHGQCKDVLLEPPTQPSATASGNTGSNANTGSQGTNSTPTSNTGTNSTSSNNTNSTGSSS